MGTTGALQMGKVERGARRFAVVGVGLCLLATAPAMARPFAVVAAGDPQRSSEFTLNFGELGGIASANITQTDYEIEFDAINSSARFVNYRQQVDPITLPGGFSTGDIIVQIVPGSSVGVFDERTGQFETTELYEVHFAGDLSAFGLVSPVVLASSSGGAVELDPATGGRISMAWTGDGELANPFDPSSTLAFEYTCDAHTIFAPEPNLVVRLVMVPDVLHLDLPRHQENNLLNTLDGAAERIENGNLNAGVVQLETFIRTVERNKRIPVDTAAVLVLFAEDIIDSVNPRPNHDRR